MAAQWFSVVVTCRIMGVSRSGFYDWEGREPSARSVWDAQMLDVVQWSHERSRGTYRAQRVHADLTMERGGSCGVKRVERLMNPPVFVVCVTSGNAEVGNRYLPRMTTS